jgi:hypothetical protein
MSASIFDELCSSAPLGPMTHKRGKPFARAALRASNALSVEAIDSVVVEIFDFQVGKDIDYQSCQDWEKLRRK